MRARNLYVIVGSILVLLLWLVSDPDLNLIENLPFGSGTVVMLLYTVRGILLASMVYVTRKAMFDYPEADFQSLGSIAKREPVGAALYAIAISISTLAFAIVIAAAALADK